MTPRPVAIVLCLVAAGCSSRFIAVPEGIVGDGGPAPMGNEGGIVLPEAGPSEGGPPPPDAGPGLDAGPDMSFPPPDGPATCTADLQNDPGNCGRCGRICSFSHALPRCEQGACKRGDCLPGALDLDGIADNGCEYLCTPGADPREVCDDRDNDCNGKVDELTDKQQDIANCGGCGRQCAFLHAEAACQSGRCVLGRCQGEWRDANGMDSDGCECQVSNAGAEVCDGFDNDCNGKVDDVPASVFVSDDQHCGACNRNCLALAHAVGTCQASACAILACEFGFRDLDGRPENGCEQACPGGFIGGVEICDGQDNDCDGMVDAADADLQPSTTTCEQRGACSGSVPRCQTGRWICSYGADVETTSPGQLVGNETRCDGKDNDCDGCIDESFPQVAHQPSASGGSCPATVAATCTDTGMGACQGRGRYVCGGDGRSVTCQIDQPGAAPATEICDGLDNNCDGVVDNSDPADPARIRDPMVAISGGGLPGTVYVFTHEASRPDATASSAGQAGHRACSRAGVLPWTNVRYPEAAAACAAAGKRLCTEAEWQRACQTAAAPACQWSFASACTTAMNSTCNVYEHDGNPAVAGDQDVLLPAGSMASCTSDWNGQKIFDLTGNAREWTGARGANLNPVRGGAMDSPLSGATCTFSFAVFDDTVRLGNTGFRCCSDSP